VDAIVREGKIRRATGRPFARKLAVLACALAAQLFFVGAPGFASGQTFESLSPGPRGKLFFGKCEWFGAGGGMVNGRIRLVRELEV
jgi:hypothetical protein